jgi:phosphatidylglycerophosphate synthase
MRPAGTYSYDLSIKSDVSDERINVYIIRPIAGILVRGLFHTHITPNHVTVAAIVAGFVAAYLYGTGTPVAVTVAGLCLSLKDILDSADGQLARAKQQYSRAGRFLDSIGDLAVNLCVFAAIGNALVSASGEGMFALLAALAFAGTTLRVSYHVHYQTSFLHLQKMYFTNRITEEIRESDQQADRATLSLQKLFQRLYGWQDRLMVRIDRWCRGERDVEQKGWYADKRGLLLSGGLGLGTELFLLTIFSVARQLELYLYCNVIGMNGLWLASILYRKYVLARRW